MTDLDLDAANSIRAKPLSRLDMLWKGGRFLRTYGRIELADRGLGPVRSRPIARGWPRPGTPLCLVGTRAGLPSSGGVFVDDVGRNARWEPHFGRMDPLTSGERVAYRLADLWWVATLAGLLALSPVVVRRRVTAFGPAIGAALAIVFAAGL